MPKQIKLGLDKVPAPVTKQFTQLIDIEGNLLFDAAGNPVVTEDEAVLGSFSKSASATSIFSNNYNSDKPISVPIAEQFSGESEVSSSILGVPRAEEQLSLFENGIVNRIQFSAEDLILSLPKKVQSKHYLSRPFLVSITFQEVR